ncbi:MAG TPA: TIGR03086 family metal-binding protein [Acidimicrobiales bacterium]|nr:TIGR03086 family metal-binding protein [Acidimicrobiales bacterium]
MGEDLNGLYAAAAADVDRLIAAVTPDQLAASTPCEGWDVRTLLNHIVGGNALFLARATGAPGPSRDTDFVGDDALGAYRASVAALTEAFAQDGFLAKPVTTPFGEGVGAVLVSMRINEYLLHGWDLAVATGQRREFDAGVVAFAERALRGADVPRGDGRMFKEEQPAPEGAGAVDALAAYMGRRVPG